MPPRRTPAVAVLIVATLVGSATGCGADDGPTGPPPGSAEIGLELVTDQLEFPLYLTSPPGDPRLFIVEKEGRIRIVRDGTLLPTPFLDISAAVSSGGERGLLGLAFPPDYASSGRFIVHYTDLAGDTRLSSFRVSSNPDVADPASETILLAVAQPFSNHNGGQILFGPDGMLYLGLGDGGSGGDPQGNGQSLGTLLGKILRLDVSAGDRSTIPADNPFADRTDARGEIWAYGLRNPWRFSIDRATGDLYIADVGQQEREEVNVSPAPAAGRGLDYGWNVMEGSACFAPPAGCDPSGLVLPVLEYGHDQGCSVTGGYVYRGAAIPALRGTYFYADFCQGWVRSFRYQNGAAVEPAEWPTLAPGGPIASFGEDAAGELYVLGANGTVHRVVSR